MDVLIRTGITGTLLRAILSLIATPFNGFASVASAQEAGFDQPQVAGIVCPRESVWNLSGALTGFRLAPEAVSFSIDQASEPLPWCEFIKSGAGKSSVGIEISDTVSISTEVTRVTRLFLNESSSAHRNSLSVIYEQEIHIAEVPIALDFQMRGRWLRKGDRLDATFFLNTSGEVVGWNATV